ncbi:MAG TPA: hypothetical protein VK611_03675, partial [Acidimicrobiales bacterium]|nr:hypothetical protein [Acidimicrobiales bacterium]
MTAGLSASAALPVATGRETVRALRGLARPHRRLAVGAGVVLVVATLAGVSLSAGPGELVGVVADPVDMAALVECLDRSSDPAGGQILLDGVVHAALGLDDARRLVVVAHH